MKCPKCDAVTYKSVGGTDICTRCGFGSAYMAEQSARRQQTLDEYKRALAETMPDKSFVSGTWTLHIYYRARGSKSEGQHGVLLHSGEAVEPQQVGEVIETGLGKLKYYYRLEDMGEVTFVFTGWNFADPSKIQPSWDTKDEKL